jgi:hypothetical protein
VVDGEGHHLWDGFGYNGGFFLGLWRVAFVAVEGVVDIEAGLVIVCISHDRYRLSH